MSLGALTIVEEVLFPNGPVWMSRVTLVGAGAYPAGGSLGLNIAYKNAVNQNRKVFKVEGAGNNGDVHFEYVSAGPLIDVAVVASTDVFTAGAAHNLSSGDAVEFELDDDGDVQNGLQSPITENTLFYVIASGLTSTAFKVSATSGGATIAVLKSGSLKVKKSDKLLVRVGSTGVESAVADQSGSTYGLILTAV